MVTYNAVALLPDVLTRLLVVTNYPAVRWLVVDNASTDGTADMVAQQFPQIRVERMAANLGYPAALNRAIALAETDLVAQVNPDVLVESDWLAPLVEALLRAPNIGMTGGRILNSDGTTQFCGTRLHPLYGLLGNRFPFDPGNHEAEVDFHSPLFLVRKTAWQVANGMNELYSPGYYEDAELGWNLRRTGWRVLFVPASRAVHLGSASFGRLARHDFMRIYERNRLLFVFRNFPTTWLTLHVLLEGIKAVECLLRGYFREYLAAWREIFHRRAEIRLFRATWQHTDSIRNRRCRQSAGQGEKTHVAHRN
ncbi:MAG: glycosyltransferase family 2 protein [Verrucomicrobia bacterium]|nr:MAG: glycosyltransferase family 2 protein [Verrucomicrobiota bacterium]